jgi:hypothetical protein
MAEGLEDKLTSHAKIQGAMYIIWFQEANMSSKKTRCTKKLQNS